MIGRIALTLAFVTACSDKPAEPERTSRPPPATTPAGGSSAGGTADTAVVVAAKDKLLWDAPAGWTLDESSDSSPRRAGYKVPKVGADKEDAELLVLFFGMGKEGERDAQWDSWFEQFDQDAKKDAVRETFEVKAAGTVETFEFLGTYKLNMGKQRPGMKRSPVQMVKKDFRMIGAVVKTPSRGNWFFRLVGPDETVRATKDAFLEMLRSAR